MSGAKIKIERGDQAGRIIDLAAFSVSIGCDNRNDVVVNDANVSIFHACIKQRERLFILEDLGALHGTYLNGDRIKNAIIKTGDRILIGKTEFSFWPEQAVIELETGLRSPASHLDHTGVNAQFPLINLPMEVSQSHKLVDATSHHKRICDIALNIAETDLPDDAVQVLLKGVAQLYPNASSAAVLAFNPTTRRVKRLRIRHFHGRQPLHTDADMINGAINSKQVVSYEKTGADASTPKWQIVLLPMIALHSVIGVLQVEWRQRVTLPMLEPLQALLQMNAAHFELLRIRNEQSQTLVSFVESLSATLEAKDTYTGGHTERVARYSLAIAAELKLDAETKKFLLMSALCHDLGKLAIPDSILRKPSLLSAEEYQEMKGHPEIGLRIAGGLPHFARFASGIRSHHERWDGTGYPDGLTGENIPFFARIIAIADAFDAIVSGRSYSGFSDTSAAVEYLSKCTDLFDPSLLPVFSAAFNNGTLSMRTDTRRHERISEDEFILDAV